MRDYSRSRCNNKTSIIVRTKNKVAVILTTETNNEYYEGKNGSCFQINIFGCDKGI